MRELFWGIDCNSFTRADGVFVPAFFPGYDRFIANFRQQLPFRGNFYLLPLLPTPSSQQPYCCAGRDKRPHGWLGWLFITYCSSLIDVLGYQRLLNRPHAQKYCCRPFIVSLGLTGRALPHRTDSISLPMKTKAISITIIWLTEGVSLNYTCEVISQAEKKKIPQTTRSNWDVCIRWF